MSNETSAGQHVLRAGSLARPHCPAPSISDHQLLRRIGAGSYGDVWLVRTVIGTCRAAKVVYRDSFESARPFEREFTGIQKFEPVSRSHDGLVDILQVGRNDEAGYLYYVMELADDANAECGVQSAESKAARSTPPSALRPPPSAFLLSSHSGQWTRHSQPCSL